jgi:hypothetical protein
MTIKIYHRFRADNQYSKGYYERLCAEFTPVYVDHMKYDDIEGIEFGKQDSRGSPSITLFNSRHCVPHQRHFENMAAIREFMTGFLVAKGERF